MTVLRGAHGSRWRTYAMYVAMVLLTLVFMYSAFSKLTASETEVDSFTRWGYPLWFMYLTGVIELGSVALMWWNRTRLYGALGLVGVMLGAFLTHVLNAEFFMLPLVGTLLLLAALVAWLNRPARLRSPL